MSKMKVGTAMIKQQIFPIETDFNWYDVNGLNEADSRRLQTEFYFTPEIISYVSDRHERPHYDYDQYTDTHLLVYDVPVWPTTTIKHFTSRPITFLLQGKNLFSFHTIETSYVFDEFNDPQVLRWLSHAQDVTERLDKGLLDFGILVGSANTEKYDYITLPATDVWGLLMRKDSPLAEKNAVRPEDLKGLRILGSRQAVMRNELSGWYGGDFERLNIAATYNLIYNAALMVDEGFGYALCLDKLINTTGDSNLCFRPLEPRLEARLILVWKKYQVFSRAVQKFLERLQARLGIL